MQVQPPQGEHIMVEIYDVDENAPWRNDPLAKRAVMITREYNIQRRKGKETIKPRQRAVIDYGMLLWEVRKEHSSNKEYNEAVLARRLNIEPFDDVRHRAAALAIAKAIYSSEANSFETATAIYSSGVNAPEKAFEGCDAETAPHMATWARKTSLIPRKKRKPETTVVVRKRVRDAIKNGETIGRDKIAEEIGVSNSTVDIAVALERGRVEGVVEGEAIALNEQGKLTKAQAKHVEALVRKFKRDLDAQFTIAVERQVNNLVAAQRATLDKACKACNQQKNDAFKDQQHWRRLINNRKPLFTTEEFRTIVMALHPDNSASQVTRARALETFNNKKLQLTGKQ
jgi:hypothetical protein